MFARCRYCKLHGLTLLFHNPLPCSCRIYNKIYVVPKTPGLSYPPVQVLTIPDHCLRGNPRTNDKIEILRALCAGANLKEVQFSPNAFHEDIRNAILERNIAGLLILIWQADCFQIIPPPIPNCSSFQRSFSGWRPQSRTSRRM